MKHKKELIYVGKSIPELMVITTQQTSLSQDLIDILIDSHINFCVSCDEPEEFHVMMCRNCFEVEDKCMGN